MKRFIVPILMLIIIMGCKEVFVAPPQSLLLATFYNSTTKLAMSPLVRVQGVGLDYPLFNDTATNNVLFPLTNKDTTRFILWLDSKSDSLTFTHKTTKKYASVEMGFYYEYKLLSVRYTRNRIDTVIIKDSLVTTKWHENIKLYLHPLAAGGK